MPNGKTGFFYTPQEAYEASKQMEDAMQSIGLTMYPDAFCANMLAFCYVMGGGVVETTTTMYPALRHAQNRFNIKGGEVPNVKLLGLLQEKIRELEQDGNECAWLPKIITRYNLNPKLFEGYKKKDYKVAVKPLDDLLHLFTW